MPLARHLTKEEIISAMKHTVSIAGAARFLGCSLNHIKRYMASYTDEETGKSLLELHKNQGGKGGKRYGKKGNNNIELVMDGIISPNKYTPDKLKEMLIIGGYTHERCFFCGFNEKRSIDGKMPLMMHFLDKNKNNWRGGNVQLLCYNCYFLNTANVFSENELNSLEGHSEKLKEEKQADVLGLDKYTLDKLREFDVYTPKVDEDPYSLVSRKK